MKTKFRKTLSLVLAVAMGLSSISLTGFAEESETASDTVIELNTETVEEEASTEAVEETAESEDGTEVPDADLPDEAVEETEEASDEEGGGDFDADIVLSDISSSEDVKTVNIQAYADAEEDTYGYVFFWQYDGTFPDDASAWAGYFNTPYDGIVVDGIDEDFSEIYLPVTLSDGSTGSADTEVIRSSDYSCIAFEMPAGSTMNADVSLSLADATEDDLYVMLESDYVNDANTLITTDYLPLDWEGNEVSEETEEVPFDDGDQDLAGDETEAEIAEQSNVTFMIGEGGIVEYTIDDEMTMIDYMDMDEDGAFSALFPVGEEIDVLVNSYDGYLYDTVQVVNDDGDTIGLFTESDEETGVEFTIETVEDEDLTVIASFKDLNGQEETETEEESEEESANEDAVTFRIDGSGIMNVYTDDSGFSLIESDDIYETVLDLEDIDQDVYYVFATALGSSEYASYKADDGIGVTVKDYASGLGGYVSLEVDLSEAEGGEVLTVNFDEYQDSGIQTFAISSYDFDTSTTAIYTPSYFTYVGSANGHTMNEPYPLYGDSPVWGNGGWVMDRPSLEWVYSNLSSSSSPTSGAYFTDVGMQSGSMYMRCNGTTNYNGQFSGLGTNQAYVRCYDIEEVGKGDSERAVYTFVAWDWSVPGGNNQTTEGYFQISTPTTGSAQVKFKKSIRSSYVIPTFSESDAEAGNSTIALALKNAESGMDILGNKSSLMNGVDNDDDDDIDELDVDVRAGTKFKVYYITEAGIDWIDNNYPNAYDKTNDDKASSYKQITDAVYAMMQDVWAQGVTWLNNDPDGRFGTAETLTVPSNTNGKTDYFNFDAEGQTKEGYADIYVLNERETLSCLNLGWDGYATRPSGYGGAGAIFFTAKDSDSDDYVTYYRRISTTDGPGDITMASSDGRVITVYDELKLYSASVTKKLEDASGNDMTPANFGLTWEDFSWQISTTSDFEDDTTMSVTFSTGDPNSSTNKTTIYGLLPCMSYYVREDPNCNAVKSGAVEWCDSYINFMIDEDGAVTYSDKYPTDIMSKNGTTDATAHSTVGVSNSGDYQFVNVGTIYPFNFDIYKVVDGHVDRGLGDAEFTLRFYSGKTSASGDPTRTWVIKSNTDGHVMMSDRYKLSGDDWYMDGDGNIGLPVGYLTIEETKAPAGCVREEELICYKVSAPDGAKYVSGPESFDVERAIYENVPIFAGISLDKIDAETGEPVAQGNNSLSNATFAVISENDDEVWLNEQPEVTFSKGDTVLTFTTDENGHYETPEVRQELMQGTYRIVEIDAPNGYWINDAFDGELYIDPYDQDVNDKIIPLGIDHKTPGGSYFINKNSESDTAVPDYPRRNELSFKKVDIDGNVMPYIPFLIESILKDDDGNETVIESHVIVADENGLVHTGYRTKTEHTNEFDSYVSGGKVTEEGQALLDQAEAGAEGADNVANWGIWFEDDPNGAMDVNDDYGSLYDGYYRITEIQCDANASKNINMLQTETFRVENTSGSSSDSMSDNAQVTIYDPLVNTEIELSSYSTDILSDTKTIASTKSAEVSDVVSYTHVTAGGTYRMETQFIDIDDESVVPIVDTNDSEAIVNDNWVTKVFTPEKKSGTTTTSGSIEMTAVLDTSGMQGHTIVAVDRLYQYINGNWLLVSRHIDYSDEDQMLYFPDLHTLAHDEATGDQVGSKDGETTIIDTVDFSGLAKGVQYVITMDIVDASTGESVTGETVNSRVLFSRNTENYTGTVTMPAYTIDSSLIEDGATLVVIESLYEANDETGEPEGNPLVEHDDLLDEDQSIYFVKVESDAVDTTTGSKIGAVPAEEGSTGILDDVTMSNLVDGMEYTVKGSLIDLESSDPENGSYVYVKEDGTTTTDKEEAYTMEYSFTAEEDSEEFSFDYTLETDKIAGLTITVLLETYHNDVLVNTHPGVNEYGLDTEAFEKESVYYPAIKTNATDDVTEEHISDANGVRTIEDRVYFAS